jgi:arylsulfatase A-like enzyme
VATPPETPPRFLHSAPSASLLPVRYVPVLLLLCACGGPDQVSGSEPADSSGRGVLVVAVDALRWDHTSFAGYDRDTTPQLAAWFADHGTVFADTWSPGPNLLPAHVALLTGCDPTLARRPPVVLSDGSTLPPVTDWFIPPGMPTLAEEFLAEGWSTGAFVDHGLLEERRGFERGFRDFVGEGGGRGEDWHPLLQGVGRRFLDWYEALDQDDDWFAYVHFNDLEARWSERWQRHGPKLEPRYDPRPELDFVPPVSLRSPAYFTLPASRQLAGSPSLGAYEAHYDTALGWLDGNLRRLITMLDETRGLDRTTVVIVGTYGIGFGEGGLLVQSGSLSSCDLHVPLLILPAPDLGCIEGQRVGELVGLADVAPTLLALNGLRVPAGMQGASLVPLLRGRGGAVHDALFASHSITEGFSVTTTEYQYATWDPASRGPGVPEALSWYGSPRSRGDDLEGEQRGVRVLVPRGVPAWNWLDGELAPGVENPIAEDLHALGVSWFADMDRALEVLHPSPWNEHARTPGIIEDLRAKGLIGDDLP